MDRLLAEKFDEHYAYFEEFQKYFLKKIEQALKEVDEGKCRTMEEFCAETEAKSQII